ncbi:MAG: Bug family tripartite tricarboxylate transporter substrate binding protein [Burkholderiales bacterium]
MLNRLRIILLAGACALASSVAAQDTRPLTIVLPFPAGGGSDAIARALGERIAPRLGRAVVVDARPGGSGLVASRYVLGQPADGNVMFLASPTVMIILPRITKLEFDPVQVFAPVANVGANPFILGVHQSVPARDLKEFVDLVRRAPGRYNYASGGSGTSTHLVAALALKRAEVDLVHIPYKGGAPAILDLVAGHVHAYFGNPVDFRGHAGGAVRLLATSGERRSTDLPEVPTIAETYPGFRLVTWNGLVARAGTPAAAVERVSRVVVEALKDPDLAQALRRIGVDPLPQMTAEFAETIRRDRVLWDDAIRTANIKID